MEILARFWVSHRRRSATSGGFLVANGQTLFGRTTADAGFDLVDLCDAAQALGCNFRAVLLVDVVQLAAGMGPTVGQRQGLAADAPGFAQGVIAGISVRRANSPPDCLLTLLTLQDAVKAP